MQTYTIRNNCSAVLMIILPICRSRKGISRVVGGTPFDSEDQYVDAGSYWGSAGSPPESPMELRPPILLDQLKLSDMRPQDIEGQV